MKLAKKKIYFIGLSNQGGLAHYAHEFCSGLALLGHEVSLQTLGVFEVPQKYRLYEVVEIENTNKAGRIDKGLSFLRAGLACLAHCRKSKPDAVFINGYQPLMAWPFAVLRSKRIPLFCIQHEVEPRVGDLRIGWFQKDFYRKTSAMVVHRHTPSKDLLVNKYKIRTPVVSMDLGLYETDLFGKGAAGSSEFKSSILSFGTVRSDKGLDILVRAYPGMEKCQGLRLVIAGQAKGNYGEYFSTVIAGKENVSWDQNYIPSTETGKLYRDAAFVVLPFIECTQSASLRLAMFFETPVIASAVGEIPHFINTHQVGMLVPPGDVDALREAISTLANDAAKRAWHVENIRRLNASQKLSWRRIIQTLLMELEEKRIW